MGKAEELNFIENGKWFQTVPGLCSSKIERNCTSVNTNINLQLAYYILEFPRKFVFSGIQSPEAYLESSQLSMMKLLALYYFCRSKGPEYATDISQCLLPLSLCIKNWIISLSTSVS